jgi:hypothetical protein
MVTRVAWLLGIGCTAAALLTAGRTPARAGSDVRPIEVSVLPSGEGALLLDDGQILVFDTRARQPHWSRLYRLDDATLHPADLELAVLNGEPTAVVVLSRDPAHSFLLRVGLRRRAPQLQPLLAGRGPVGDIAFRPGSSEALFTSMSDRSIYGIEASDPVPEPRLVSRWTERRPGLLGVRSVPPELLVADVDTDTLFLGPLSGLPGAQLCRVNGLMRAIALDRDGRTAYVTEGRHGRVWRVRLPQGAVSEVNSSSRIRDASDIAVDDLGRLWILDDATAKVFVLEPGSDLPRQVFANEW